MTRAQSGRSRMSAQRHRTLARGLLSSCGSTLSSTFLFPQAHLHKETSRVGTTRTTLAGFGRHHPLPGQRVESQSHAGDRPTPLHPDNHPPLTPSANVRRPPQDPALSAHPSPCIGPSYNGRMQLASHKVAGHDLVRLPIRPRRSLSPGHAWLRLRFLGPY